MPNNEGQYLIQFMDINLPTNEFKSLFISSVQKEYQDQRIISVETKCV